MTATLTPAAAADLCVKCGLCIPHCPSYALTQDEGDSPRGRIALVQGLASGQLEPGVRLQAHLDGCLGCRACEPVCPAQVPYMQILDAGRAQLEQARPHRGLRLSIRFLSHRWGMWLITLGRHLWQFTRAARWARPAYRWGALGRGLSLLPEASTRSAPMLSRTAIIRSDPKVQLWAGCTGHSVDAPALAAAQKILAALGFTVETISDRCCGALAAHAGLADLADRHQRDAASRRHPDTPLLAIATGCAAHLQQFGGSTPTAMDALTFIRRHWPQDLRLRPLAMRVAIHRACTQLNVLRTDGDLDWLLQQIPQATVCSLDRTCCGAAGHHLLHHPHIADGHLALKMRQIESLNPDVIVSSNIGCSLHLGGGLRRLGLTAPKLVHPLVLMAQQWPHSAAPRGESAAIQQSRSE